MCSESSQNSPSDAPETFLSPEEIRALPLFEYGGEIELVRKVGQVNAMLKACRSDGILGFDTETRPSFRKGESYQPSLLQLAVSERVYVVQLKALDDLSWIASLLGSADVIKAGVSLQRDVQELQELEPFDPRGFVELAMLGDEAGIRHNGLRGLAAAVLGYRISKSAQRSDWSRPRLSRKQIAYAATDAWVCRQLYLKLKSRVQAVPPSE